MRERGNRGILLIISGMVCIMAAMTLVIYNMWADARAGYMATVARNKILEAVIPDERVLSVYFATHSKIETDVPEEYRIMPVKEIDGVNYVAVLSIPDLNLELPVRSEWSYDALNYAPCRYAGSAYMNDLVICAHNYTQHFGRLKDLEEGSEVLLVDMEGNLFRYEVSLIETLMPTDIRKMINSEYDLSLFTCTLGGRTRVTVRCTRI